MGRPQLALLLFALSMAPLSASAGLLSGRTYCVGGYDGQPPYHVPACNLPDVQAMHRWAWHDHVFVTDGKACYDCWDEEDNTCHSVFLRETPGFRQVDEYECARLGVHESSASVLAHVIDGQSVVKPSPEAQLSAKLEAPISGFRGAGDSVTVGGSLRDGNGAVRPLTGGAFVVTGADGSTSQVRATVLSDGTVKAQLTMPAKGELQVHFVPDAPQLRPGEQLIASASASLRLLVDQCDLRAEITSPAEGEPLLSGDTVVLSATIRDAAGNVVPTPGDLKLVFAVQASSGVTTAAAPSGEPEVHWNVPPTNGTVQIAVGASGKTGNRNVCLGAPRSAVLSETGLTVDATEAPDRCYTGMPCIGVLRLRRPSTATGRAHVEALLTDPATRLIVVDTGTETPAAQLAADDRYEVRGRHERAGGLSWSLALESSKGRFKFPQHKVQLRPALQLVLPASLDFGTLSAGAPALANCQRIDFSASQAAEEHRWSLEGFDLAGCQSSAALTFQAADGSISSLPLGPRITVDALDPTKRWLTVCLNIPACSSDSSPPNARLVVAPLTAAFNAQAKTVALRWTVTGRTFLGCHGWWFLPLAFIGGVGFIAGGFIRPARFPELASIKVASSEAGLRRASAALLRDCQGSSAGFYRDARLGLDGSGDVSGNARSAMVVVRASRSGLVEIVGGGIERKDRATGRLQLVDASQGYAPNSGEILKAGGVWFTVENA